MKLDELIQYVETVEDLTVEDFANQVEQTDGVTLDDVNDYLSNDELLIYPNDDFLNTTFRPAVNYATTTGMTTEDLADLARQYDSSRNYYMENLDPMAEEKIYYDYIDDFADEIIDALKEMQENNQQKVLTD